MPHVINGIGTWYWGKDNLHVRQDCCEFCGQVEHLRSYDTREFFVVLFIPVIPLRRRRVIDECPRCRRHRFLKLSDWNRARGAGLSEAVHACEATPNDAVAARRALAMCATFHEEQYLPRIAGVCRARLAGDFETQMLLAAAYESFERFADAEDVYRLRLKWNNTFEVRQALARNLLMQSRPDEAWELIAHVLNERRMEGRGLVLLIAEAYQAWGMHAAVLDILDACARTFPELVNDKAYARLRKTSLKYKGTSKPIKSKLLIAPRNHSGGLRRMASRAPMLIAASILAAVVGTFAYISHSAASARKVYVVNGLSAPYDVLLNGTRRTVRPHAFQTMMVPEGDIAVSIAGDGIAIPDQRFEVRTNFFARPFADPVFVLNPDRSALIVRDEAEYGVQQGTPAPNQMKFYCGDLFLAFDDVDFPFQEFPESIRLERGTSATRSRVTHLCDLPISSIAGVLVAEWNVDKLKDWVRRLAKYEADDAITASLILSVLDREEALRVLDELRRKRPLRIEAHRGFQQLVETMQPERDLLPEYRALLAEAPEDPVRLYLLGRITPDADEARAFYVRGQQATPPLPHALNALAFDHLIRAQFDEALPLAQEALKRIPRHPTFHWTYQLALEALGRFDEALSDVQNDKVNVRVQDEVYLLARAGKSREVKKKLADVQSAGTAGGNAEDGRMLQQSLQAMLAYVQGDPEQMIRLAETVTTREVRFARAVTMGDFETAAAMIEGSRNKAFDALLVSLVARDSGHADRAEELVSVAAAALPAEGADARRAVPWLLGDRTPEADVALRIALPPTQKVILLTALGQRFPGQREQYFALARKLNFDTRFPHLLIDRLTAPSDR